MYPVRMIKIAGTMPHVTARSHTCRLSFSGVTALKREFTLTLTRSCSA